MKKRKILVTFYSRTGNTKKVAQKIANLLNADQDEILDLKSRKGAFGWWGGGKDVVLNISTKIKYKLNPKNYGLVVIGTPIWVNTLVPAIKKYLEKNKITKIAFFCTCGNKAGKSFIEMEKLSQKPLATLELRERELGTKEAELKIKSFCKKL